MHTENIQRSEITCGSETYMLPPPTMLCHLLGTHTGIYPHEKMSSKQQQQQQHLLQSVSQMNQQNRGHPPHPEQPAAK
jgi:hypothetical protein